MAEVYAKDPRPLRALKADTPPSYVLTGGTVRAGGGFVRSDDNLLVVDGMIEAIGLDTHQLPMVPVYDLNGATILPGLQDTHFHMTSTGVNGRAIDLSDCADVAEVLATLNDAAAHRVADWVIAGQLDETQLAERRSPTLTELDRACPRVPVYVNDRGLHYSLINSSAADRLGLSAEARRCDGRLQEGLSGIAKRRLAAVLPASYAEDCVRYAAHHAAELGLTTLHAMEGGDLFDDSDVDVVERVRDELPVRVRLMWSTDDVDAIRAAGYRHGGGDVCIDGSLGSRTARLRAPYADQPGVWGEIIRDLGEVTRLFRAAEQAGIQFGVHAIGDVAVEVAVLAIEVAAAPGNPLRHRIEHFGLPTPAIIDRAATAGIGVATQPGFAFLRGQPGGVYHDRLGAARLETAYPLRSLLDAGLVVSGGSDSDVTNADPFFGIHAAVNHPQKSERIGVHEALTMYTGAAAWMGGADPDNAYIGAGSAADLTIVDVDPFDVPSNDLRLVSAVATVVAGRSVGR